MMRLSSGGHSVTILEWRRLANANPTTFHRDGSSHPANDWCPLPGCGTHHGTTDATKGEGWA